MENENVETNVNEETQNEESQNEETQVEEKEETKVEDKQESPEKESNSNENEDGETKKKQSRALNAEYARKRREAQKRKAEQEKIEKKAYRKGLVDSVKGVNPFTKEEIKNEADIDEFINMMEADKQGYDPISDYSKFLKIKQEKEKNSPQERDDEWYANDRAKFEEAYPDLFDKLANDEKFDKFASGLIGHISLVDIYEGYQDMQEYFEKEVNARAEEKAKSLVAKKLASVGSVKGSGETTPELYTLDQIKKMSDDEIDKNYDKVKKSLEAQKIQY